MFADMMASSSLASVIELAAEAVDNNYGPIWGRFVPHEKVFSPQTDDHLEFKMPQPHSIRRQLNYN